MSALADLSLVEAAEGIRRRAFSSRELTEATLSRLERHGRALNCVIDLWSDAALAAADAADRRLGSGEALGPLHGVPLAHKDMFYRAGRVCSCGSKIRRSFVPAVTATVLDRLDAAGALHVATLNMSEFAFGPTGHNAHFGPARNPWHPAHVSGGSSSGSGAAVAARLVYGALGSDTGGSVRLPAAACGVVGLKPTQSRVSRHGAMGLSFSLDCIGPLTRTVADCARVLGVIAGNDPRDATSSRRPVPDYEAAVARPDVRGLRIGRPDNYYFDRVTPEVARSLDVALRVFQDLGAEVVDVIVPDHDRLGLLHSLISTSEAATLHGRWLRERPHDYGAQVRARIEPGLAVPATHYLGALHSRAPVVRRFIDQVLSRCDVMFTPVLSSVPPTIEETDVGDAPGFHKVLAGITHCTAPTNYLTLPGLSLPAGRVGGLPSAFQLVGRPFAEATLLRAGAAFEEATGFSRHVPEPAPFD